MERDLFEALLACTRDPNAAWEAQQKLREANNRAEEVREMLGMSAECLEYIGERYPALAERLITLKTGGRDG